MSSEDRNRRRIQRVQLDSPLAAKLERTRVTVLDVSAEGARIEHDFPLVRGRKISLQFFCDGQQVVLGCEVIRCKFEQTERGAIYRSGLRFSEGEAPSVSLLRDLIAGVIRRDFDAREAHLKIR